jgi:hypothetical protein
LLGSPAGQNNRGDEFASDGAVQEVVELSCSPAPQNLPVKVVVFNNESLSFIELEMKAAGIVTYGTDRVDPDFAGIARSAGLFGARRQRSAARRLGSGFAGCRRRSLSAGLNVWRQAQLGWSDPVVGPQGFTRWGSVAGAGSGHQTGTISMRFSIPAKSFAFRV